MNKFRINSSFTSWKLDKISPIKFIQEGKRNWILRTVSGEFFHLTNTILDRVTQNSSRHRQASDTIRWFWISIIWDIKKDAYAVNLPRPRGWSLEWDRIVPEVKDFRFPEVLCLVWWPELEEAPPWFFKNENSIHMFSAATTVVVGRQNCLNSHMVVCRDGVCVRNPVPDRGARPITGEKTASTKADWTKLLIKQSETSPDHMAATFMGLASERQRSGINSAFFLLNHPWLWTTLECWNLNKSTSSFISCLDWSFGQILIRILEKQTIAIARLTLIWWKSSPR